MTTGSSSSRRCRKEADQRGDTCRGWCDGRERPALINKNVDVTMLYLFPGPVPGGLFFASMVVLD